MFSALASRSAGQQQQQHPKRDDQSEWALEGGVLLSVPGSLATVLENLPLVYDTYAKSLQPATADVRNDELEEKVPFKRGHHRRSSYDSAQIQLAYHSRFSPTLRNIGHSAPRRFSTASDCYLRSPSPAVMVDSSSGSIRFFSSKSTKDGDGDDGDNSKDNDDRKEDIFVQHSENASTGSLTALTTITTTAITVPIVGTVTTADSAIGESLSSKRSSLDRHSEISAGLVVEDDDDDDDGIDNDNAGVSTDDDSDSDHSGKKLSKSKKGGRSALSLLPNISFTKKLFSRNKQQQQQQQASTWRIFGGKHCKNTDTATTAPKTCSCTVDDICCSTTGLILEDRPSTLPAKPAEEQRRHRAQYLALIEAAKRKEARRARQRKQFLEMKRKEEDEAAAAVRLWSVQILPNWEHMKDTKRCRELWWRGIPAKVRGQVWSLVIGNELNLTPELYEICVARARQHFAATAIERNECADTAASAAACFEDTQKGSVFPFRQGGSAEGQVGRESTLELIHLDVSRTFPNLGFFQKDGPYEKLLLNLLGAYVCYRPDIGYVQSMCFLGAMLLLQMHQPYLSFQAFANLLNRPVMLAFFGLRQPQMTVYFIAYDQYFEQELPKLHQHFDVLDVRPDLYLIEWLYTLYTKSLPFDVSCRIWDIFLRDGEQFLFSTALGIIHLYEQQLEEMNDFDEIVNFLTHLPQSMNVSQLFDAIEPFMKCSSTCGTSSENGKRRSFQQIYADVSERVAQAAAVAGGSSASGLLSSPADMLHGNKDHSIREIGNLSSPSLPALDAQSSTTNSQQEEVQATAAALRSNVCNMKMSKSLSGFLGDLLLSVPTREEDDTVVDSIPKRSGAPTAL